MSKPIIIVAFPGTGKTTVASKCTDGSIIDLDRPDLSKEAYLVLIHDTLATPGLKYLLLPSWPWLSDELITANLEYTLVYPHPTLKPTYIQRYIERGSPDTFVLTMDQNWDTFLASMASRPAARRVVMLHPHDTLETILNGILSTPI